MCGIFEKIKNGVTEVTPYPKIQNAQTILTVTDFTGSAWILRTGYVPIKAPQTTAAGNTEQWISV